MLSIAKTGPTGLPNSRFSATVALLLYRSGFQTSTSERIDG